MRGTGSEKDLRARSSLELTPTAGTPSIGAPPAIHALSGSSGRPLDAGTRAFFEPRFGKDFSQVRVHTGPHANESARQINARAYAFRNHIAFRSNEYRPTTSEGRRLIAHELAHVVQQGAGTPHVQRWAVAGDTATADDPKDVLWDLAKDAGTSGLDWTCIIPLSMRTSRMSPPPADFKEHYERYVQIGDRFDISNLRRRRGPRLLVHLFTNARDSAIASRFYPGMTASSGDVDIDISNAAGDGKTPIRNMVIFGHSSGTRMFGGAARFDPGTLSPEPHSYALANAELLPRRCWLTGNAHVRSVGCSSTTFATEFAGTYLRRGSSIHSTTTAVSPCCSGVWDRLAFSASSMPGSAILDGPFRTASAFHRGRFWARIRGRL